MGRVSSDGGVVGGRVQALGPKGIPMQVRDAPTLPSVLIAPINLALLRGVGPIVVEGGVDGLTLNSGANGPIVRKSVLDNATGAVLEKSALADAISGPNSIVVARGIGGRQSNCVKEIARNRVCVRYDMHELGNK